VVLVFTIADSGDAINAADIISVAICIEQRKVARNYK